MSLPHSFEAWVQWLTYSPLLICSLLGAAISFAKWLELRQALLPPDTLVGDMARLLDDGLAETAATRLGAESARGVPMVHAALVAAALPHDALREQVALAGRRIGDDMERGLGALALLASLGPLFGLLGTVVGIVLVFNRLAEGGGATPADLAGGIGTALYTTIIGLIVGILALVCHRYLSARVDRNIAELERFAAHLVNVLGRSRS